MTDSMEKNICFIGLDIGTTNIKSIAVNPQGDCLCLKHRPSAPLRTDGEFSPKLLWEGVCTILRETVQALGKTQIGGIAVSAIGCAQICLDEKGNWIRLPQGSEAASGDRLCKQWIHELGEEEYYRQFHYPPESDYFLFRFYALKCNAPSTYRKVKCVLSVADYVNYRLCGDWIRDPSLSGSFCMLDRNTHTWSRRALSALEVDGGIFGRLGTGGQQIGMVTDDAHRLCGLPAGTPVCTGGHDYLCAALGCNWTEEEGIFNVLGTYEMISRISRRGDFHRWDGAHRVFSDLHVIPGYHTLTMEYLSGVHLNWFVDTCLRPAGLGFEDLKIRPGAPGKLRYYPRRGIGEEAFAESIAGAAVEDIYRAIIEGLCYRSRENFDYARTVPGASIDKVCSVGGGSNSPFWMQVKADILGMQICVPQIQEASGTGAAILAAVGSGYYGSFQEALQQMSPKKWAVYAPDAQRSKLYQISYAAWQEGGNKQ